MNLSDKTQKIKSEGEKLSAEVRGKVAGYLAAAFGLVAGLAWNDAIKSLIEYIFPLSKNTVTIKFIYAIIVTLVVVVVTTYLVRFLTKKDEN